MRPRAQLERCFEAGHPLRADPGAVRGACRQVQAVARSEGEGLASGRQIEEDLARARYTPRGYSR